MKITIQNFLSKLCSLALFSFFFFSTDIKPANAAFNNLVPCKESPAFKKRLDSSLKKLDNRRLRVKVVRRGKRLILRKVKKVRLKDNS